MCVKGICSDHIRCRGFTLIELLVVIAVISVLAALLLPAFGRAKSRAYRTQCYNNQRQIGIALALYVDENRDFYPAYPNWADYGGKKGTNLIHSTLADPEKKPLNKYTVALDLYHCPADHGDALYPSIGESCWDAWGTSYLMSWAVERYRVEHVGGDTLWSPGTYRATPIKGNRVAVKAVTKLISSDWPWFGDRNINDPRSVWHNDRGKPVFPTLIADGHVENFKFPPDRQAIDGLPPDINFTWW
jgi:prepilin-type N-terminal cleavage/methylation domain-containing protein